jgi:hypothetical protein
MLFSPATQTCCSEDGDGYGEFFDEEFYACAALVAFLWFMEPFAILLRESHLSLDGQYLCNNYTLFMTFGYL